MSVSDPIADYLTIIRNGSTAGFKYVDVPASKIKQQITRVLYKQGFVKRFIFIEDKKQGLLRIWLKYDGEGKPVINMIKKISTPGRREYVDVANLPRVRNNLGTAILTTPKGILTSQEAARTNVGGEVLCHIW
jgi:small subunit ribosomal protein S8